MMKSVEHVMASVEKYSDQGPPTEFLAELIYQLILWALRKDVPYEQIALRARRRWVQEQTESRDPQAKRRRGKAGGKIGNNA